MMNSFDAKPVKEIFCRLFVLAIQNKVNFLAFTKALERSEFAYKIEDGKYDEYFHKSLIDIFYDITNVRLNEDTSFGIYNDAYWCGVTYFYIKHKTQKPLSYVLLKMPFDELIELYNPYHEADYSKTLEYFLNHEKDETILKRICKENRTSLSRLSKETSININTLKRYAKQDEHLYSGSFQNILTIAKYFNITPNLFLEKE